MTNDRFAARVDACCEEIRALAGEFDGRVLTTALAEVLAERVGRACEVNYHRGTGAPGVHDD